jgi:hypothetical protein
MARQFCALARPARYGLKNETRFDLRVRDTWEITKSRIAIDERWWGKTFRRLLDRIRRDLGLADGARLTAHLHNMLVDGPAQFFGSGLLSIFAENARLLGRLRDRLRGALERDARLHWRTVQCLAGEQVFNGEDLEPLMLAPRRRVEAG